MPTKREIREKLEQTQEISVEEIQDALKEHDVNAYDDLDVPNFQTSKVTPFKKITENDEEDEPVGNAKLDKTIKIIIGTIILVVFVLIAIVTANIMNSTNTEETPSNTSTPATETTATSETQSGSTSSTTLDYYYEQAVRTAITNKLDDLYDTDGYTKPSSEQFIINGSQNKLTVSFTLTVGDSYSKNYTMPAEFQLEWNGDENKYDVVSYTIDDSEAIKSGFKAHTSKKQAEKKTQSASTEGSEVSNFEVTVRNSVTVTITCKGSGTVTAYAIAEDGTTTELASTSGGTTTKTVKLDSGKYKLVLYATENAGYSWNYTLG